VAELLQDGFLPIEAGFEPIAKQLVHELMLKVRRNVERLVSRLEKAGYLFHDPEYYVPPTDNVGADIDEFERVTQLHVPLVLRAWTEVVGRLCLMGTHPGWPEITYNGLGGSGDAICADPLVVYWDAKQAIDEWQYWKSQLESPEFDPWPFSSVEELEEEFPARDWFSLDFAPDPGHKANYSSSGSYCMRAGEVPSIDGMVTNDDDPKYQRTFLNHLRDSFASGGFPGWANYENAPAASLKALAKGLDRI